MRRISAGVIFLLQLSPPSHPQADGPRVHHSLRTYQFPQTPVILRNCMCWKGHLLDHFSFTSCGLFICRVSLGWESNITPRSLSLAAAAVSSFSKAGATV